MKISILIAFTITLSFHGLAQSKIEVYKTTNGNTYSKNQKGSIERLGNFIVAQNKRETTDTIYHSIFYYHKSIDYTSLQKKYIDKPLQKIMLHTLSGELINTEKLKGKIVMINFWDSEQEPYIPEIIQLNELKEKFRNDVHFISVAKGEKEEVRYLTHRFNFNFTIIPEAGEIMDSLGINDSYPINFFVDQHGIVKAVEEGLPVDLKLRPMEHRDSLASHLPC